ncbi:hypothetical protein FRC03_001668 [Tulasnella sp. 419]|nr:hypothetical protein FRC03_001668 [Tulasnella sp. 419]
MPRDSTEVPEYIIIGGGTTGLVVAGRLAESGSSVCVIEAGKHIHDDDRVDIPGYFGKTLGDPQFDWSYTTVPQKYVLNRTDVVIPRGKALGGTSVINSMTWGRASKDEYDYIANLGNGIDWSWDNLLPYFKRSETVIEPPSREWATEHGATFDKTYHGNSGPLKRGFVPWLGESHVPFFKAMNNLGVPTNHDSCSGNNLGVFTLATSIDPDKGTRVSSAVAYFEPNSHRINLIDQAHVQKILLERDERTGLQKAIGVEYERDGKIVSIGASKEVVISAGAYETPKILELSGIGDQQRLEKLGIRPKVHLPGVGENLQDHLLVPSSFEMKKGYVTGDYLSDPEYAANELAL